MKKLIVILFLLVSINAYAFDAETVLLAHFNGDGATYTPAETGQVLSYVGTAQLSRIVYKDLTGNTETKASLSLDGDSDEVTAPDNDTWNFGAGDFTIDLWVYFNNTTGSQIFCSQYGGGSSYWQVYKSADNRLRIEGANGGTVANCYTTSVPTLNTGTWYHIAFVRSGASGYIFLDGVSLPVTIGTAFGTLPDVGVVLEIGSYASAAGNFVNGYIDELRISKGVARWTANFNVPTAEYNGAAVATHHRVMIID